MLAVFLSLSLVSADAVNVRTKPRVYAGEGLPTVTVVVKEQIEGATLSLKREDGKTFLFKVPRASKGEYPFSLEQAAGTALDYEGALQVQFPGFGIGKTGQSGEIKLSFKGEVVLPITIDTQATVDDIREHRFHVKATQPITRIDMVLTGEGGAALGKHVFTPKVASTEFVAEWPKTTVPVVRIDANFVVPGGNFKQMQLFPWFVEVQHQDVNFPSAKFDIPAKEEDKMVEALSRVLDAAKKAVEHAPVALYVIGHTDTVGAQAANAELSEKRARSLAKWFRAHGFNLPILYTGMGEERLAVATPDNTDKAENRRAQYVLAIDPPAEPVHGNWQKL